MSNLKKTIAYPSVSETMLTLLSSDKAAAGTNGKFVQETRR